VDDYSSKLDFPSGVETVETIHGDHRQMAKFASKEDQGYRAIASILTRLRKEVYAQATERTATDAARVQEYAQVRNVHPTGISPLHARPGSAVDNFGVQGSAPVRRFTTGDRSRPHAREVNTTRLRDPYAEVVSLPQGRRPDRNRIFEVPLSANPRFTGRKPILSDMRGSLRQAQEYPRDNVIVLVGLGGCGKSEVALQFSHEHRSQFLGVFWIDATSKWTVKRSLDKLRKQLSALPAVRYEEKMRGKRSSGVRMPASSNSVSTVNLNDETRDLALWLHRASRSTDMANLFRNLLGSWLLVFDNLDDPHMVPFMREVLPLFVHGVSIVTTRNRDAAKLGRLIEFPMMSVEESAELLLRSIHGSRSSDVHHASVLAERLGYLPLALDQAAAYINYRQWSISEYHDALQRQPDYLLNKSSEDRYAHIQNGKEYDTVLKTWEMSFNHLRTSNTAAADLLQLLAFLYHADIWEDMFRRNLLPDRQWSRSGDMVAFDARGLDVPVGLSKCLSLEKEFDEAYAQLLNFSLVKRNIVNKRIWIHPASIPSAYLRYPR
jgi:hypothetical protein